MSPGMTRGWLRLRVGLAVVCVLVVSGCSWGAVDLEDFSDRTFSDTDEVLTLLGCDHVVWLDGFSPNQSEDEAFQEFRMAARESDGLVLTEMVAVGEGVWLLVGGGDRVWGVATHGYAQYCHPNP